MEIDRRQVQYNLKQHLAARTMIEKIEEMSNRKIAVKFDEWRKTGGTSPGERANGAGTLLQFCRYRAANKLPPLEKTKATEITSYYDSRYPPTKNNDPMRRDKSRLNVFFTWLYKSRGKTIPVQLKEALKPGKIGLATVGPEDLWTADEYECMATNFPEPIRTMVALEYDVGLRPGEMCALNYDSFKEFPGYFKIHFPSDAEGLKTGRRTPQGADSAPILANFLANHQCPESGAPAFLHKERGGTWVRYSPATFRRIFKQLCADFGIRYRRPYTFRHTAATRNMLQGIVGPELDLQMGWAEGGNTRTKYSHATNEQKENRFLESKGVKKINKSHAGGQTRTCSKCFLKWTLASLFCGVCKTALTSQSDSIELERQKEEEEQFSALARWVKQRL